MVLFLVAGREDDSAAEDHRAAAQASVVSLLNRGEEGVDVGGGVEDGRLIVHEQCSHS